MMLLPDDVKIQADVKSRRHGIVLLGVLAVLAAMAAFVWTAPMRAERRLQQASLAELQATVRREPDNARAYYYLGLHWQALGQLDAARAAYAKAATLDPAGADALIAALRARRGGSTTIPTGRLLRDADALLATRDAPGAERAYTAIVDRAPTSAPAFEGLGRALEAQGRTEDAFRAYNRALQLQPGLPEAQYHLAQLYYDAGFPDEAERRIKPLVQRFPNDSRFWYGLGVCYKDDESKKAEAEDAFRRAAALDPKSSECLLSLADAEVKAGEAAQAEQHYRAALRLAQGDMAPALALGQFLVEHPTTETKRREAEALLRQVLAKSAHNPAALTGLGRLALDRGQDAQAVADLEDAETHAPGDFKIWYLLGRAYRHLGNASRAAYCDEAFAALTTYNHDLSFTEELARKDLKDPGLRLKLARLYAEGGQYARAINQYQMCKLLDPGNTTASGELDALTRHLKATGEMPSMSAFNGMMLASVKNRPHPGTP